MSNFTIDFAKNPEMTEVFSRKKTGEDCTLEIDFQIDELDANGVKGTINKVTYDEGAGDEKTAEPDADHPVMMEMKMGKGTKSASETMTETANEPASASSY